MRDVVRRVAQHRVTNRNQDILTRAVTLERTAIAMGGLAVHPKPSPPQRAGEQALRMRRRARHRMAQLSRRRRVAMPAEIVPVPSPQLLKANLPDECAID